MNGVLYDGTIDACWVMSCIVHSRGYGIEREHNGITSVTLHFTLTPNTNPTPNIQSILKANTQAGPNPDILALIQSNKLVPTLTHKPVPECTIQC